MTERRGPENEASNETLVDLMQQLDVGRTTAHLYYLLLAEGPLSHARLAKANHGSGTDIDFSIQKLLRLRLIGTDRQRSQRYYYATNPFFAWLALTADLVWKTDASLAPITNLPSTANPDVEHLRMLCSEMSAAAQRVYRPQAAALVHKEHDAETEEELAQLACEIIYQARSRIVTVSKSPRLPKVSSFWAVITDRIQAGASYRRVVDLDEVRDHGLKIVSRDMEEQNIDLRVLERANIRHKFYLVDNKFLVVFHQRSTSSSVTRGVGRVTNQPQIIARYRKRFEQYAQAAMPGHLVVEQMRTAGNRLLLQAASRLEPIEVEWIEDLINFGKFSRLHIIQGWSKERVALAERRAAAAGIVSRNADGDLVPIYPIDEATIRANA